MASQSKTPTQLTTPSSAQFGRIKHKKNQSVEVNTFLRSEIAHLWPTLSNITALQKECAIALPQLFLYCQVLQVQNEQLVLAAPNAALATKLKQQLPKLLLSLQKAGWQINAIRIKVQANQALHIEPTEKQCQFTDSALSAFSALEQNLTGSKHNTELLGALRTLLNRYGK